MVMEQILASSDVGEFDCGDQELNSFIMEDAVSFYEKNGFVSIRKPSAAGKTCLMCYDLMSVAV